MADLHPAGGWFADVRTLLQSGNVSRRIGTAARLEAAETEVEKHRCASVFCPHRQRWSDVVA
jgi:hypothetical protein